MHIETVCKNCNHQFIGKYCNNCGEKVFTERDKSVRHLFHETVHFLTHFEGNFFNTLKLIVTRPGKLSLDYCNGIRKKYFKPLSFFLLLVILYLLFPVFEGLNMKLYYHVRHSFYGSYAMQRTIEVMEQNTLTDIEVTRLFEQKSEKTSKFLLFLILPFLAGISWLLGFKKRVLYFDHFIFTTEIQSFFLLWGFLILPLILVIAKLAGITTLLSSEIQAVLAGISLFVIYTMIGARRFFKFKWWYAILYTLLITFVLLLFLENIYKFILFLITINLI